jgi:lipid II:glycine glycyltransferase (peptidoglycan interpeptide bridge formation enzyme)
VEPVEAINDIKRVTLMKFGKKRRQYRYEIKKAMKLKDDDNVQSVVERAGKYRVFDAEDFEIQVDRWLSKEDKVFSHLCQTLNL